MLALLVGVIALPGAGALACLVPSFLFGVEAIAAGEHLGALREHVVPCSGCVLCGMSRAFAAFSHGDFALAMDLNSGVVVAWPLAWMVLAVSAFGVVRTLRDRPRFFPVPSATASSIAPTAQELEPHVS